VNTQVNGTRLTPKSVYVAFGECFNFAEISARELETKGTQFNNGKPYMTQARFDGNPLINSLLDFNFAPLLLEFPGKQFDRNRRSLRQFSTW
jgi:hypothetical protein